ncbi:MAG: SLC13 family permease [Chloroflexota bacterium]
MKGRQWIGPILGILILFFFLVVPPFEPLTSQGMKTLGVFFFTIIWWATVGVNYPSIICIALFALTGVMTPEEAFARSFGSWLVLFLIGCMGMGEALRVTGFSRRFALWFMTLPFTEGHPWRMISMFLLACTLMGAIMSSSAVCIVFMAIGVPMVEAVGFKKGDAFAAMLMMGIAWAATASLAMTPIAHAGNILVMDWIQRDLGLTINFPHWMSFGIPMGLLVYLLIIGLFRFVVRPDMSRFKEMAANVRDMANKIGPMKLEEKIALGVFSAVIVAWVLPGTANSILPGLAGYLGKMGYTIPPLVGASLLCLIHVKSKPVVTFHGWMADGVEWGSVILVVAIMVIGGAISDPATGIPALLTDVFQPIAASVPTMVFVFIAVIWVVGQTNFMSNLASMMLVYSIMVPVAIAGQVGNPVALGVVIGAASNYAFALPSATTTTAIVTGSGWVPVGFMGRYGVIMVLPVMLLFAFIGYPFACWLFR